MTKKGDAGTKSPKFPTTNSGMMLQASPGGEVIRARTDCGHWQMCFALEVVVCYNIFPYNNK